MVLYLLSKQSANPLVRNKWGETAFDAGAAVFEVWICEVRLFLYYSNYLDPGLGFATIRSRKMAWYLNPV